MLEAVKLCKAFDGRPVIQDFSIRMKPGSRVCLTGPSGSGKTTLLRLLMGLEKPDSGTLSMPRGTRFSAVFQENRLLEQLTAEANVALVSAAPRQEITALLNALGRPYFAKAVILLAAGLVLIGVHQHRMKALYTAQEAA